LAYRYFARKEEMVVAVYQQCSEELEQEAQTLPVTTIGKRFAQIVRANFGQLLPYRQSFAAILGVALNPRSEAGVFGERMGYLRIRTWRIFEGVVAGAKDAPAKRDTAALTTLFYTAYLLLMLFWVQDGSHEQADTERLLQFVEDAVWRMRPLLKVRLFARFAARLAKIVDPLFGAGPG
jgi:AcrR family transcriptional regulator